MPAPPVAAPGPQRYSFDRHARFIDRGRILLGGEPVRLLRLSDAGARALVDLLAGVGNHPSLARRLSAAGILHPVADDHAPGASDLEQSPRERASVTAVIPLRGTPPPGVGALLAWLGRCPLVDQAVLVDDGSDDRGAAATRLAEEHGARLIIREMAGGPAAARNEVLALDPPPSLVLFVDADTSIVDERWLDRCVAHFADDRVAAVAPRVVSVAAGAVTPAAAAALSAYETLESPLDLGPDPGLVGAARRLSYVPSTALVVRADLLREVGGWDERLRFGEDVDLVRRLGAAGWLLRYEPVSCLGHAPRTTVADFARQRFGYGTAAAAVDARHPGTVAPLAVNPTAAVACAVTVLAWAGWIATGRRRRWAGLAVAGSAGAAAVAGKRLEAMLARQGCPDARDLAAGLAVRSTGGAIAGLATALRRVWWPALLPAIALRRTRRRAVALLAATSLLGHSRSALCSERPLRHLALGLLDDCAYGAGVLIGCWREGSFRAIAPRVVPGSGHQRADGPDRPASNSR